MSDLRQQIDIVLRQSENTNDYETIMTNFSLLLTIKNYLNPYQNERMRRLSLKLNRPIVYCRL